MIGVHCLWKWGLVQINLKQETFETGTDAVYIDKYRLGELAVEALPFFVTRLGCSSGVVASQSSPKLNADAESLTCICIDLHILLHNFSGSDLMNLRVHICLVGDEMNEMYLRRYGVRNAVMFARSGRCDAPWMGVRFMQGKLSTGPVSDDQRLGLGDAAQD